MPETVNASLRGDVDPIKARSIVFALKRVEEHDGWVPIERAREVVCGELNLPIPPKTRSNAIGNFFSKLEKAGYVKVKRKGVYGVSQVQVAVRVSDSMELDTDLEDAVALSLELVTKAREEVEDKLQEVERRILFLEEKRRSLISMRESLNTLSP